MDFVDAIAADYPIAVLARLLDTPEEMTPRLISWGNEIIGFSDPEYARVLINSDEAAQYRHLPFSSPVSQEIYEYGRKLAAERKDGDGEDLVSKLVNRLPEDGVPLTQEQFDNYFLLLIVAGNETTRQAMALGTLALAQHPDQYERIRADRALIPSAVEELLRWSSPVWHFRRTATTDTEIRGVPIAAGDKVVVWFAAANRDPDHYPDPHRFDVARNPSDNLTFGRGGPHHCLGAHLARLEVRVYLEELAERVARIELAGEPVRLRSNFTNGLKRLPVRMTLA
jgi:cytochrome P450